MRFLILTFICCVMTTVLSAQYKFEIDIKNYTNDTLILGNYFGEKQVVKDTMFATNTGHFEYSKDSLSAGMYILLLKPENTFIQFLVNGTEKKISISFDSKDLSEVRFKGSPDNDLFYKYLDFLKDKRVLADTLKARITRAEAAETTDEVSKKALEQLDKDVQNYQKDLILKNPKTLTAYLIQSNIDIDIPEFEEEGDALQMKRYLYYKKHYFDNIDISHPALIRMPFTHPKINTFITKLSNQQPDSLIKTVDYILEKLEPNPDAYRYYLADFLNQYAQMKMVGLDAIYVHLVDKYYTKGKATWVTEENLKKMSDNADDLRPILIGKIMPDFTTYKEDGTPVRLHSIKSKYTILLFWAPDCGHCKKVMPGIVDFYSKNKGKNLTMLTVCTKGGEKTETCWPAIKEKNMTDFINTADEYQRYHKDIRIKSTPKIFILDDKKEIIVKDIPGEELERIFNEVVEFEEKRRIEKQ
ncbi:MAG: redoxin domain-containing protein [Saprospiraceae bacterium]|nr:redoxin domain-containing protein [Saprospiraceae bacterium]